MDIEGWLTLAKAFHRLIARAERAEAKLAKNLDRSFRIKARKRCKRQLAAERDWLQSRENTVLCGDASEGGWGVHRQAVMRHLKRRVRLP